MTAMSMLAMAIVIYLFGGYVDAANEHPDQHGVADYLLKHSFTKPKNEKESMIMNPKRHAIAAWNFPTWFALFSPVIGVLLGLFGAFLVLR